MRQDVFGSDISKSNRLGFQSHDNSETGTFRIREEEWWARRDSNPQPSGYEPPALTN